jgi:hypothetical protein
MMTRSILATIVVGAGLSQAATIVPPSCASLGTFAQLQSAGACTVGVFTVKNATFGSSDEGVSASDFNITTAFVGNSIILSLSGSPFSSGDISLRTFFFGYTIDPPPDIIKGISAELQDADGGFFPEGFAPADDGDPVSVDYAVCAGAAFVEGGCAGDILGFSLNVAQRFPTDVTINGVIFDSPVNTVGVNIRVSLMDGGSFGALDSTFPLVADVPEPGAMAMMGLAVPVILALRRRRRARA